MDVNRQASAPYGWNFQPNDEELLFFYLKNKLLYHNSFHTNLIADVHIYNFHPEQLSEMYKAHDTKNVLYFFTLMKPKYGEGSRPDRTVVAQKRGFWKATGRCPDFIQAGIVGIKRDFVFYEGTSNDSTKINWMMKEYRIDLRDHNIPASNGEDGMKMDEYWVLIKMYYNETRKG